MAKNNKQGGDRLLLSMVIKLVYQPYGDTYADLTGWLPRVSPVLGHVSYSNDFEVYTCQHDFETQFWINPKCHTSKSCINMFNIWGRQSHV